MANHPRLRVKGALLGGLLSVVTPSFATNGDAAFDALATRCAPDVHPATLRALVGHESGFDPLVIGVNGTPHQTIRSASAAEAAAKARQLLDAGKGIDLGLGQINSQNLKALGLTPETAFDACKNVAAAARLLTSSYRQFRANGLDAGSALDAALSAYNTGNAATGIASGYVGDVHQQATPTYLVPSIVDGTVDRSTSGKAPAVTTTHFTQNIPMAPPADWDVFGDASGGIAAFISVPKSPLEPAATAASPVETTAKGRESAPVPPPSALPTEAAADGPVVLFAEPTANADSHPPPGPGAPP